MALAQPVCKYRTTKEKGIAPFHMAGCLRPVPSVISKKVKASHTRYRALSPELIPVYRQSARRWLSHPPGGRLPLLSARPAVTFPAAEHHRPLAGTKLYCLVTEARRFEQLAQGCYAALPRVGFETTTCWLQVQCATAPLYSSFLNIPTESWWYVSVSIRWFFLRHLQFFYWVSRRLHIIARSLCWGCILCS